MHPPKLKDLARALTSATDGDLNNLAATRRGLILAPLLAALPATLLADPARAIDPAQTQVTLPDQYQWKPALPSAPAGSFVSSGCVRLTNEDVEDLYRRVTVGTRVIVLPGANTATSQLHPRHKPRALRSPEETGPSRGVRGSDPEGQNGRQLLRSDLPDLPL
jgi:L,D-transpeptidase catalytic domain